MPRTIDAIITDAKHIADHLNGAPGTKYFTELVADLRALQAAAEGDPWQSPDMLPPPEWVTEKAQPVLLTLRDEILGGDDFTALGYRSHRWEISDKMYADCTVISWAYIPGTAPAAAPSDNFCVSAILEGALSGDADKVRAYASHMADNADEAGHGDWATHIRALLAGAPVPTIRAAAAPPGPRWRYPSKGELPPLMVPVQFGWGKDLEERYYGWHQNSDCPWWKLGPRGNSSCTIPDAWSYIDLRDIPEVGEGKD